MQRELSDEVHDSKQRVIVVRPGMDAWERQQVFREMVVQQLRNGPLSRMRRRRIVQFAAQLGITAVLAGRLVQEAQRLHDAEREPSTVEMPKATLGHTADTPWNVPHRAIVAIVVGLAMLNSWLILRLLG